MSEAVKSRNDKMSHVVNKGNVFVVEDDAGMRALLSEVLMSFGYVVTPFSNAIAALDAVVANDRMVDVIISDLNMPKLNGLEFIGSLKKINFKIPVILVTAFGNIGTATLALEKGAFGYLSKPFPLLELDALIQKAIAASATS